MLLSFGFPSRLILPIFNPNWVELTSDVEILGHPGASCRAAVCPLLTLMLSRCFPRLPRRPSSG